jgi:hypothetical protein
MRGTAEMVGVSLPNSCSHAERVRGHQLTLAGIAPTLMRRSRREIQVQLRGIKPVLALSRTSAPTLQELVHRPTRAGRLSKMLTTDSPILCLGQR